MKIIFLLNCQLIFNNSLNHITQENNFIYSYCYFNRLNNYVGNGGIFLCESILSLININNCIFFQCSCTGHGGAFYFKCIVEGTNINLNKLCISHCFSGINNWFQFGLFQTHSLSNNNFTFLSINCCSNNSNSLNSIEIDFGNIILSNLNSSNNNNKKHSSLILWRNTKLNCFYSTIINNFVSDYIIIWLESLNNENNFLNYFNIIKNNSPLSHGVISNIMGKFTINNCILINNYNNLFYISSGNLNVINCKIFHENNNNIFIGVSETNNTFENTITFFLNHFNSFNCQGNDFQSSKFNLRKFNLLNYFFNNNLYLIF